MDITMIGRDCAKVTITAHECRELDICYESFSPESITARLFLAAVIARLETLGAKIAAADKLTAEVFDNGSEGLVMYLSGKGMKIPEQRKTQPPVICKNAEEVIRTSVKLSGEWSLYRTKNGFAFVNNDDDSIISAKIKEHGRLISDAPLKKLKELF